MLKDAAMLFCPDWAWLNRSCLAGTVVGGLVPLVESRVRARARAERCYRLSSSPGSASSSCSSSRAASAARRKKKQLGGPLQQQQPQQEQQRSSSSSRAAAISRGAYEKRGQPAAEATTVADKSFTILTVKLKK